MIKIIIKKGNPKDFYRDFDVKAWIRYDGLNKKLESEEVLKEIKSNINN
jgi:hypothetical protein